MKRGVIAVILFTILFYLKSEEKKLINSYRQPLVNYRLNSYLAGDCPAKGIAGLIYEHSSAKSIRHNGINSLFILRDDYYLLDMGMGARLVNPVNKREPKYFRKSLDTFFIYNQGKIFSFEEWLLRVIDEKSMTVENKLGLTVKGRSLKLYYPLSDSYLIVTESPPVPGSGQFSLYIARRKLSAKDDTLIWEHDIEAGAPRPPVTGDNRIILAFPNKVVSCDFQGNLKTLYKDSFGAISISLGDDDTIYLLSIKSNDYYLTALTSEGSRRWERKLEIESYPSQPPIVSPNSMVYVIERKKIIAFRKGEKLWDYPLAKDGYRDGNSQFATVLSDDTVLVSDNNRVLYLNEFGEPIWIYKAEEKRPFRTQPILDENGQVVVANDQNILIIK